MPRLRGVRIVGVSPDPPKSHKRFAEKHGLEYTLLADTAHELCENVGVWVEKSMYGKKYMGVVRTTFLLDAQAVVERVFEGVKADLHGEELVAALQER
jgi:thioredoxin-dependent peroxiredoxin